MNLIDEDRALYLYQAMPDKTEQSGGSAANSAYGFACLGGKAGFAGQVAEDEVGNGFIRDLQAGGVTFAGQQTNSGPATARSMILVTPDTIRSMNTYLGTSLYLDASHLSPETRAEIIYLEGYLFDAPEGPSILPVLLKLPDRQMPNWLCLYQMPGVLTGIMTPYLILCVNTSLSCSAMKPKFRAWANLTCTVLRAGLRLGR